MGHYQDKGTIPLAKSMDCEEEKHTEEKHIAEKCNINKLSTEERNALILSHYGDMKRYLSVLISDPTAQLDAIQDTMVEAMVSIHNIKDITKVKYYMLTIARRVAFKYINAEKEQVKNQCTYEDEAVSKHAEVDYISDRQLYGYISGISDEDLAHIIDKTLNEKERKVILLYYVYEHKLKEIAKMLGTNENTVKSISARAKKKLKVKLEEAGYND